MHTRRMATFLLGAWLGGSLLMILIQAENLRFTNWLLSSPSDQATAFLKKTGSPQDLTPLLRYEAAEQNRRYQYVWEQAQFGLALILGTCLFFGTQRRAFPLIFCALMLIMLIFEHVAITPELAFRGRQTDFPPGDSSYSLQVRLWALAQVYAWVEGAKLVLGVLLSGYLFIFRARRTRKQVSAISYPYPSHVED